MNATQLKIINPKQKYTSRNLSHFFRVFLLTHPPKYAKAMSSTKQSTNTKKAKLADKQEAKLAKQKP